MLGHVFHGNMPLSIMSLCGILAVSGVIVNDTLVLVDRIERALSPDEAAALTKFVKQDGRGMITLIGYNFDNNNPAPERDRANTALTPFGLAYQGGYFGNAVIPTFDQNHPVSMGIMDVNFAGGIEPVLVVEQPPLLRTLGDQLRGDLHDQRIGIGRHRGGGEPCALRGDRRADLRHRLQVVGQRLGRALLSRLRDGQVGLRCLLGRRVDDQLLLPELQGGERHGCLSLNAITGASCRRERRGTTCRTSRTRGPPRRPAAHA